MLHRSNRLAEAILYRDHFSHQINQSVEPFRRHPYARSLFLFPMPAANGPDMFLFEPGRTHPACLYQPLIDQQLSNALLDAQGFLQISLRHETALDQYLPIFFGGESSSPRPNSSTTPIANSHSSSTKIKTSLMASIPRRVVRITSHEV